MLIPFSRNYKCVLTRVIYTCNLQIYSFVKQRPSYCHFYNFTYYTSSQNSSQLREEDLPMELQDQNWFSAASALRVYGQYLNLDRDHNGMLSIDELAG